MTFVLYDSKTNKKINIKSLTLKDKINIIESNYYIKNIDKKLQNELSQDNDYLPLFDVVNDKIHYIYKTNIFKSIKHNHFRVLNKNLLDFLNKYKYSKKIIDIVKLFNFEILESIFLKFVFYNSNEVGADISYYKNPAFIKNYNIKPFLKKSSIVNTALNTGIITVDELPISNNKLEKLYDSVKEVLFTDNILLSHMELIKKHNLNGLLNFYSFYGASFLNNYLREVHNISKDDNFIKQINQLNNLISDVPKLKTSKLVFRFINNDAYLNLNKVGDIYINDSFMSCTRKPNINAENNEFGFILLKINLTDKFKGYYISIESDSVFPYENEILIKPGVHFRLKSIDDKVEFYLFEDRTKYLRNIKIKYELEIINVTEFKIPNYNLLKIPELDLKNLTLEGTTGEEKIDYFINKYCRINNSCYLILPDKTKKLFYCNYYNSTDLYSKFYYYKNIKGFFMFSFDEYQNLDIFLEFGDELIVNYPSKFLKINELKNNKLIYSIIANLFEIDIIRIFPIFKSIIDITNNKNFLYENIKINSLLYNIIYDKNKENIVYNLNNIKIFLNEKVNINNVHFNIIDYLEEDITYNKLIRKIFNKNPIYIKYMNISLPVNILNCHYLFNASEYLIDNNIINIRSMTGIFSLNNIEIMDNLDDNTKLIFNRESSIIKN